MVTEDPYYNRQPVPKEFTEHVGFSGLAAAEENQNRERKYSRDGGDLRKFWNPKHKDGTVDPFYARKPVSEAEIAHVGESGLSPDQEFATRERKYSLNGVDVRKFSKSPTGFIHPTNDPFYSRKPVSKPEIAGVGDSYMSKAEEYEVRERKQSFVNFSDDPFQIVAGKGHRQSVSGVAGPAAAAARRRSSAVAPDAAAATATHGHHSGYNGDDHLETIQSRVEPLLTSGVSDSTTGVGSGSDVDVRDKTGHITGGTGHTMFYDAATGRDADGITPH